MVASYAKNVSTKFAVLDVLAGTIKLGGIPGSSARYADNSFQDLQSP